jgi:undecaprenyl-diphosphatase
VIVSLRLASRYGDWGLSVTVAVLLVLDLGARCLPVLSIATAIALVVQKGLKRRWDRIRPCQRRNGPPQRAPIPDQGSFPSGHTLHAVMAAVIVSGQLPSLGPVFIVIAALIAASRVVLGVHYPSDVVAGGTIGGIFGAATNLGLG